MPELPEVETMRRGILPILGSQICGVSRMRCRLKPISITPSLASFRKRTLGKKIAGIGRVGKRVVLQLNSEDRIVLEPRMTGLVLLADPPNRKHCRLRIDLKGAGPSELLYWDRRGLGSVRLFSAAEFDRHFGPENIGPDALAISADGLRQRLGKSNRAIKVALLDQKVVAGIGNLYASEILHLAKIHPLRSCQRLRRGDWSKLQTAMVEVLEAAIDCEGSTLADGTYRNALNQAGSYQKHHRVYDRAGETCRRCRGKIVRIVQSQRSTFFCPMCQRKRNEP